MIRTLLAPNPSAMTLDGTRTFIVGARSVAIIDPGPDIAAHIDAIVETARARDSGPAVFEGAVILLTHVHPDHGAGAHTLAGRLNADVRAIARGNLCEGDTIHTDAGALITLATPGHTPDHAGFHHAATATVFCGDLMMGGLDTALVSPPEGNLRQYLASLDRIRALEPARIMPAHGPPFDHAHTAISRYIRHRMKRCDQVMAAFTDDAADLSTREIADRVYGGEVPAGLREMAVGAVVAYLQYLEEDGRVVRAGARWRTAN